jgi:hypothetical protein
MSSTVVDRDELLAVMPTFLKPYHEVGPKTRKCICRVTDVLIPHAGPSCPSCETLNAVK